ncbi:hypothetical protein RRG08_006179, partial [Elysia crispata]
ELKSRNSTYWVGAKKRPSISEFFWIDRTSSDTTYLSWYVMAPQLPRSPLVCTYINEPGIMKGLWADDSCSAQRGFVCELPAAVRFMLWLNELRRFAIRELRSSMMAQVSCQPG